MPPASSMPAVTTSSPSSMLLGRVDVPHLERLLERPDDLAGREARLELADDRRALVGDQDDIGEVRPELDDPAGQRPALGDDDVALLDAVVAALADRDQPPELRRLAGDDLGGGRPVLEPVLELEQAGQEVVLALDLLARSFSRVSRSFSARSAVLSEWSRSISPTDPTTPATPEATPSSAPWTGRSA